MVSSFVNSRFKQLILAYVLFGPSLVWAQQCFEVSDTSVFFEDKWREEANQHFATGQVWEAHQILIDLYRDVQQVWPDSQIDTYSREIELIDGAIARYKVRILERAENKLAERAWLVTPSLRTVSMQLGALFADQELDTGIALPCATAESDIVIRDILSFSDAMNRASPAAEEALEVVNIVQGEIYKQYSSWVADGLPMWPWEYWINGYRVSDKPEDPPPTSQTVFLRPTGVFALDFAGSENSNATYGVAIEPIGFIRYGKDSQYKKWRGLSLIASVTENHGAGYGISGRWNNLVGGLAFHPRNDQVLLYINIDLFNYTIGDERRDVQAQDFMECFKQRVQNRSTADFKCKN